MDLVYYIALTLTVFLVQSALVDQIRGSAPPGMPNVYLLDITGAEALSIHNGLGGENK